MNAIKRIIGNYKKTHYINDYQDTPREIYSNMMMARKEMGLEPGEEVTIERIKQERPKPYFSCFDNLDDDVLYELFNSIAQNTIDKGNENKLYYAKRGTKF